VALVQKCLETPALQNTVGPAPQGKFALERRWKNRCLHQSCRLMRNTASVDQRHIQQLTGRANENLSFFVLVRPEQK